MKVWLLELYGDFLWNRYSGCLRKSRLEFCKASRIQERRGETKKYLDLVGKSKREYKKAVNTRRKWDDLQKILYDPKSYALL